MLMKVAFISNLMWKRNTCADGRRAVVPVPCRLPGPVCLADAFERTFSLLERILYSSERMLCFASTPPYPRALPWLPHPHIFPPLQFLEARLGTPQ